MRSSDINLAPANYKANQLGHRVALSVVLIIAAILTTYDLARGVMVTFTTLRQLEVWLQVGITFSSFHLTQQDS